MVQNANCSSVFTTLSFLWKSLTADRARSKARKSRKSRKSRKFFSKNFKSEFSILAVGQNQQLGNKKTRNNFSEISSDFSEFSFCHFFIFQKKIFFNILKYRNSCSYIFLKIRVLKNFGIFVGRQLRWSLFFKRLATYWKKLQNRCFPANIAKF